MADGPPARPLQAPDSAGPQPRSAEAWGRAAAARRAGSGGRIRGRRRGGARAGRGLAGAGGGARRGVGGGTCLPPQEDEAAAAAAGVAGLTEPNDAAGGHRGLLVRRLRQRPGRVGPAGRTRGEPGHAPPPTRALRGRDAPLSGGAVHAAAPRALRAGPRRAGERAGTLGRLVPGGSGLPARRQDVGTGGRGAGAGRAGGGAAGVIVLQLCAPEGAGDVEGALGPARPRRPALRESLRSRAGARGAPRGRPTSRRGGGAEAASAPSHGGPAGGGVWRGASQGKGASFCLRGRCAARLRARAGGRGPGRGPHLFRAPRARAAASGRAARWWRLRPELQRVPGPRHPHRLRGVGWGLVSRPSSHPSPPPPEEDVPASLLPEWLHVIFRVPFEPPKVLVTPQKCFSSPREACLAPPALP